MDLFHELAKLTQPPFSASAVVRLSPVEIERLQASGEITPLERIPKTHGCQREVYPTRWGRGRFYGYGGGKLKWR